MITWTPLVEALCFLCGVPMSQRPRPLVNSCLQTQPRRSVAAMTRSLGGIMVLRSHQAQTDRTCCIGQGLGSLLRKVTGYPTYNFVILVQRTRGQIAEMFSRWKNSPRSDIPHARPHAKRKIEPTYIVAAARESLRCAAFLDPDL